MIFRRLTRFFSPVCEDLDIKETTNAALKAAFTGDDEDLNRIMENTGNNNNDDDEIVAGLADVEMKSAE